MPLGAIALFLFAAVALAMVWAVRQRMKEQKGQLLALIPKEDLVTRRLHRGEDADAEIRVHLLDSGTVSKAILLGTRFAHFLTDEEHKLRALAQESPGCQLEVFFHDPFHPEAMLRDVLLGFDREQGVLNNLDAAIRRVREHFPSKSALMVSKAPECRATVIYYENGNQVAILQGYRHFRLGTVTGGIIISSKDLPTAFVTLEDRFNQLRRQSVALSRAWIEHSDNGTRVHRFCREAGIIRDDSLTAEAAGAELLASDDYRRFVCD